MVAYVNISCPFSNWKRPLTSSTIVKKNMITTLHLRSHIAFHKVTAKKTQSVHWIYWENEQRKFSNGRYFCSLLRVWNGVFHNRTIRYHLLPINKVNNCLSLPTYIPFEIPFFILDALVLQWWLFATNWYSHIHIGSHWTPMFDK